MGPHADFVCRSKHCLTSEGASVYDLPVDATHCPKGHKRLTRLFNAVNVNSDGARRLDRLVEPAYEQAHATKRAVVNSPNRWPMVHPVPVRQLDSALQATFASAGAPAPMRVDTKSYEQPGRPGTGRPITPIAEARRQTQIIASDRGRK